MEPEEHEPWYIEDGKVRYKVTTDWERRAVQAADFKLVHDQIYARPDSLTARYAARTIARGGV